MGFFDSFFNIFGLESEEDKKTRMAKEVLAQIQERELWEQQQESLRQTLHQTIYNNNAFSEEQLKETQDNLERTMHETDSELNYRVNEDLSYLENNNNDINDNLFGDTFSNPFGNDNYDNVFSDYGNSDYSNSGCDNFGGCNDNSFNNFGGGFDNNNF